MHHCLNVDEIVRVIACELVTSGEADAVALACCCRSFEDPVLDELWAMLNQLFLLLGIFPGDVWNEGGCTVSAPRTHGFSFLNYSIRESFNRFPTALEWARFWKYARRIRELSERGTPETLSLEVLSVIQLCTTDVPLLPNLKILDLWGTEGSFIPFIPLFLSPNIAVIKIGFVTSPDVTPVVMVASLLTAILTRCPNLQTIALSSLPRDPMITAVLSGMLLGTNRESLQQLQVDSPLTETASKVIYKLPNLCNLSVVIERDAPLPSVSLSCLTELVVACDDERGWPQLFHGATLGKLESVTFFPRSEHIGNFLEVFQTAALSLSIQKTLSRFGLWAECSWNPNYSSLLPFTQLVNLSVEFSCSGGCSSTVDDDIIISLAKAMPKLEVLILGDLPCCQFTIGVTAKGLVALAHHCPNLSTLCVHFQVATLAAPPPIPQITPIVDSTTSWMDCALTRLTVGGISVPEESVSMVALTLSRIFPRIECIGCLDQGWKRVENAIRLSKQLVACSGATLETGG